MFDKQVLGRLDSFGKSLGRELNQRRYALAVKVCRFMSGVFIVPASGVDECRHPEQQRQCEAHLGQAKLQPQQELDGTCCSLTDLMRLADQRRRHCRPKVVVVEVAV